MSNIMMVLKSEIIRLACKEAKRESTPTRKIIATQRSLIADLRRQVSAMQKELSALKKTAGSSQKTVLAKNEPEGRFWITGKGVKALRKKLGLTQANLARLAGVSLATIVNWEATEGKISLRRKATAARLQEIRGMKKRAVAEILGKTKGKKVRA